MKALTCVRACTDDQGTHYPISLLSALDTKLVMVLPLQHVNQHLYYQLLTFCAFLCLNKCQDLISHSGAISDALLLSMSGGYGSNSMEA